VNRENFEALQGYIAGVLKSGIGGADGKHGLEELPCHSCCLYGIQRRLQRIRGTLMEPLSVNVGGF
jgi:hypothetical protein